MAATRPYHLVFKGVTHIIEAPNAALAVHHIVGADISELRPARAAEVSAWIRGGQDIPVADGKRVEIAVEPAGEVKSDPATDLTSVAPSNGDWESRVLAAFEDWAGYDRGAEEVTIESSQTVSVFAKMHPNGQLDLMTFDVLRQRAPEFEYALIAEEMGVFRSADETYVAELEKVHAPGLARLRARLEEQPMPYAEVVEAIAKHAGFGEAVDGGA